MRYLNVQVVDDSSHIVMSERHPVSFKNTDAHDMEYERREAVYGLLQRAASAIACEALEGSRSAEGRREFRLLIVVE